MKGILLGIAFILFGFVMLVAATIMNEDIFMILGFVSPFVGLAIAITSAVMKDK